MTRLLTALALVICASMAWAGDAAKLNILGFNKDGTIFAFEQYGVQDGSGFPYAERFYIRTANDSFVKGTPIKIRVDDETSKLEAVRKQTMSEAVEKTGLADQSFSMDYAHIVASREITEMLATNGASFYTRPFFPNSDRPLTLAIMQKPFSSEQHCNFQEMTMGFELALYASKPSSQIEILHQDKRVPKSRSCPIAYHLKHVITNFADWGNPIIVTIIAIRSYGFEGPDHRYMAIAKPLPKFE